MRHPIGIGFAIFRSGVLVSGGTPVPTLKLDFRYAANSQYIPIISYF